MMSGVSREIKNNEQCVPVVSTDLIAAGAKPIT